MKASSLDFWRGLSLRALLPFMVAVFATFAGFGFLIDIARGGIHSPLQLGLTVAFSGTVAVAYFLVVRSRRFSWFFPLVLAQVLYPRALAFFGSAVPLAGPALLDRLALDAGGVILGLAAGYGGFVAFIQREGARRLRLQAEVDLAREIHESLVPPLSLRSERFEVLGQAFPASEVGGDLVDAVVSEGSVTACILDVSGHGVPAGTLMAALKGALRMRLLALARPDELLADLDVVLRQIRRPNMFATAAVLGLEAGGEVRYSVAGHLPVLHWHAATGEVTCGRDGGPALGILEDAEFPGARLVVAPGDLLVLVTDGLVEVTDASDREWGLEGVEAVLRAHGGETLALLLVRILEGARAHGLRRDDQTLLLVRVLAGPPGPSPA